ncbi:MAG: glycosyltransferase family A protein, partial [Pseudomonas neustonica]
MACFNHANYVEKSIRSVMEHDYDNIEFLVVDDG